MNWLVGGSIGLTIIGVFLVFFSFSLKGIFLGGVLAVTGLCLTVAFAVVKMSSIAGDMADRLEDSVRD